jgi:hypothetical protein
MQGERLFQRACVLYEKTSQRRIRIRRIRLCWQHPFQGQLQQVGLFAKQKPELECALSHIRKRFGFSSVQWGQGLEGEKRRSRVEKGRRGMDFKKG